MPRQKRVVARTRITKLDGEYWVQAYDQGSNRYPEADYHTDDREDATATAQAMVNQSLSKESQDGPSS